MQLQNKCISLISEKNTRGVRFDIFYQVLQVLSGANLSSYLKNTSRRLLHSK